MEYLYIFTHIILIMSLGWYLITNLQWYNYKIERVILKNKKRINNLSVQQKILKKAVVILKENKYY